jgi:hypothetical protein
VTAEWRDVVGFEGLYVVNSLGQVRSLPRAVKCVSPSRIPALRIIPGKQLPFDRGGRNKAYQRCYLRSRMGFKVHAYVHRLVCEARHGPKPFPDAVIRHLNDIQTDNRPENLQWGTPEENRADQIRNRTAADDQAAEAELEAVGCQW